MKWFMFLIVAILMFPFIEASCNESSVVDKVKSFCVENNSVCDGGENPLLNPQECPFRMQEAVSFDWLQYGWFLKLITVLLALWVLSNVELWSDRNFQLLLLMIVGMVYLSSQGIIDVSRTEKHVSQHLNISFIQTNDSVRIVQNMTVNGTPVQVIDLDEYSGFGGLINNIKGWGKKVWPSQPVGGWIFIVAVVVGIIALFRVGLEGLENFFRRLLG